MTSIQNITTDGHGAREGLLVLVCTYNERQNLDALFSSIDAAVPNVNILVVDDNSPDGTAQWVQDAAARRTNTHLIQRPGKLGLGTAIRDGMQFAIDNG